KIKLLGKGGMGEVYLATQQSMQRRVALKILHDELAGDNAYLNRFLREVRTLASIRHPNIVGAIDALTASATTFAAVTTELAARIVPLASAAIETGGGVGQRHGMSLLFFEIVQCRHLESRRRTGVLFMLTVLKFSNGA
ncbi:MAG: hypothetical protein EOM56_12510, partial [Deltaproteobacteria bacterium]|nr:hypothetical protein [Deltaproteobacteria bacterium]